MATSLLTGVITNKGREIFAKAFGNISTGIETRAFKFKYGEGGFIDTISGRVPKSPQDGVGLLDVESASDAGLFTFEKALVALDLTFIAPSTMQVRCRLVGSEANDDGFGNSPAFFEIGIFDDSDNMLVYTTFSEQTKTPTKILINFVQVIF